jgi:hypothetical protein
MNCGNTTSTSICPCGAFVHPAVIYNQPGLNAIAYRVGDYTAFRRALLQAGKGETQLSRTVNGQTVQIWRPGAQGDLAVQMMEWWAYVADVLTFYNERSASAAYLRTAELPASVNRLIRLLGYRPRPGIGATGTLAAIASGPKGFTLPAGFQVQSKPGPGEQPQVFEALAAVQVGELMTGSPTAAQGVVVANPIPDPEALGLPDGSGCIYLQRTLSSVKATDEVLFLPDPAQTLGASEPPFVVATVGSVIHRKDSNNKPITQIALASVTSASAVTDVRHYRLFTSNQSVQVWQYPASGGEVVSGSTGNSLTVNLNSLVRSVKAGDNVVFDTGDPSVPSQWTQVASSTELIWYANPPTIVVDMLSGGRTIGFDGQSFNIGGIEVQTSITDPSQPPATTDQNGKPTGIVPIPIMHTQLSLAWPGSAPGDGPATRAKALLRYGWKDAGALIAQAIPQIGGVGAGAVQLEPAGGAAFPAVTASTPVLVEDAIGNGSPGTLDPSAISGPSLTLTAPLPTLYPPFSVLFNLLPVTRGKTVSNEVLGSGNASIAGQDFTLQKSPVTYLQDSSSISGDDYSSTVRVWVNGVQWTEERSFYGQAPSANVFVTSEDEKGMTHVSFGDGVNGSRLPTGTNNVIATYRYGSGAATPDPGSLTVVLQPQPGLQSIVNPVPVGGGADPDAPAKIRQLAPKSVMTFNRAISADDYEVIAAQTPGVARAKAVFSFDATEQRPRVKIWVGDDQNAVAAATAAIAGAADPSRLPRIQLASQVVISVKLTLVVGPAHQPAAVQAAVYEALLDADTGLFGANVVGIGQGFFDSQVYAACLAVTGVQAVHDYSFITGDPRFSLNIFIPSLVKAAATATGCACDHLHTPPEGGYFFLPDDGNHLAISK